MRTGFVVVKLVFRSTCEVERDAVPEGMEEGEFVDVVCREGPGQERRCEGQLRGQGVEVDGLNEFGGKGEEAGLWS